MTKAIPDGHPRKYKQDQWRKLYYGFRRLQAPGTNALQERQAAASTHFLEFVPD